jgi:hypothetical protein
MEHRPYTEKRRLQAKKSKDKHRESVRLSSREYYQRTKDKKREYYLKNLNRIKKYRKDNKDKLKSSWEYKRERGKIDKVFRLSLGLRGRLRQKIKSKNWGKKSSFSRAIGCTLEKLKEHIEKQFTEGMNWDNWGYYGWHIDHIIPLSSAKTVSELYKLCHYTNLQPLWAKENIKKSNKIT